MAATTQPLERRDALGALASTIAVAAGVLTAPAPSHAVAAPAVYGKLRKDLEKLILADKNKGPTLLRLAWHASGTYSKMAKNGGSQQGTIRFEEELSHGANAGLNKAVAWLQPIKKKYPDVSFADIATYGGVVAIETLGGPKIAWHAGRVDSMDPKDVTENGRLPDADKGSPKATAQGLRDVFTRMGFSDKEIVVLSGAHALGRCHADASGYVGPWSPTPVVFNNAYYTLLSNVKWTPKKWDGPAQFEDPSGTLMMLPSDIVLLSDKSFKKYVDMYAKDEKLFFSDFSAAFTKLQELGTTGLVDV